MQSEEAVLKHLDTSAAHHGPRLSDQVETPRRLARPRLALAKMTAPGETTPAPRTGSSERRPITVLFADIAGLDVDRRAHGPGGLDAARRRGVQADDPHDRALRGDDRAPDGRRGAGTSSELR